MAVSSFLSVSIQLDPVIFFAEFILAHADETLVIIVETLRASSLPF